MSLISIHALFTTPSLADLGPRVRTGVWSAGQVQTEVDRVCQESGIRGRRADCLRALALHWHDHLDAAHAVVQDAPGADSAYIHGIIHRREPDIANARYWFHRTQDHPFLGMLAEAAAPVLAAHAALPYRLIRDGRWDPFTFVDAVSVASREPESAPEVALLRQLQLQEALELSRYLAAG